MLKLLRCFLNVNITPRWSASGATEQVHAIPTPFPLTTRETEKKMILYGFLMTMTSIRLHSVPQHRILHRS